MVTDQISGPLSKADILHRFIAKAIDFLIGAAMALALSPIGPIAGLLYILIADGFRHGQSPGKRMIGLQVLHEKEGSPISFKESIERNIPFAIVYIFSIIPLLGWLLLFIVGLPILLFESYLVYHDEKGIRVGDILAGTQVVDRH